MSDRSSARFIYPGSTIYQEGLSDTLKDRMVTAAVDSASLTNIVRDAGGDLEQILSDPYMTARLPYVEFQIHVATSEVAAYYEPLLSAGGWRRRRGLLVTDSCNWDGNWGGVYERGGRAFLLNVIGPWKIVPNDQVLRVISFTFLRMIPEDLFGQDFRSHVPSSNKSAEATSSDSVPHL